MLPFPDKSSLGNKTAWAGTNPVANSTALFRQFVSEPMAAGVAFSTSDTIKAQARCQESATNDNINRAVLNVMVFSQDGSTRQAVLKDTAAWGPSTTEWSTSLVNRRFADGDTLASGYTTVEGDRLVVEFGGQISGTAGTSVTGTMHFGSIAAADLAEDDSDTGADNPWFEISRDIDWLEPNIAGFTAGTASAKTTSGAVSKPSVAAVGDTMVAHWHGETAQAIGTPTIASTSDTWSLVHNITNTGPAVDVEDYVWICNNLGSSSSTVTVSWDGDNIWNQLTIILIKGADDTAPQDVTATENQGSSTTITATGVASGTAQRLLLMLDSVETNLKRGSPSSPLVEINDWPLTGDYNLHVAAGHDAAGTDTGNKTATITSDDWCAFLLAFKPPAAGGVTVTPTAGTVTFTGQTPVITTPRRVAPTAGALTFTGQTPTVRLDKFVRPTAGSVTFSGQAAGVTATDHKLVTPTAGAWAFSGQTPGVTVSGGETVTPTAGAITFTGQQPSLDFGIRPTAGALTFTGQMPVLHHGIIPTAGALTFTGQQPVVTVAASDVVVTPTAGSLTFVGDTPGVVVSTGDAVVHYYQNYDHLRAEIVGFGAAQIFEGAGILKHFLVNNAGTGVVFTVYDSIGTTDGPIWRYATAQGRVNVELGCIVQNGLYVVVSGTVGEIILSYEGDSFNA
jgi:hypothetical protein